MRRVPLFAGCLLVCFQNAVDEWLYRIEPMPGSRRCFPSRRYRVGDGLANHPAVHAMLLR